MRFRGTTSIGGKTLRPLGRVQQPVLPLTLEAASGTTPVPCGDRLGRPLGSQFTGQGVCRFPPPAALWEDPFSPLLFFVIVFALFLGW